MLILGSLIGKQEAVLVLPSVLNDSGALAENNNTAQKDLTFTVSALTNGKLLFFGGVDDTDGDITGVTWFPDGTGTPGTSQALTKINEAAQDATRADAWELNAPTAATNGTVRVTLAANANIAYRIATVQNAKQATSLSVTNVAVSNVTAISANLTTTADNTLILDAVAGTQPSADQWTASGTGHTEDGEVVTGQGTAAVGNKDAAAAGIHAIGWTCVAQGRVALVVIGVEPVGA